MKIFKWPITLLVCVSLFLCLQQLFMPKYASFPYEGGLIREYYAEVKDHDLLFIGDCEVYENFSPITLWEEYGITSYIRGSAQQYIWHSYYLLEESLRYETPDAVVFNVLSMQYDEPQREAYNRMTLDGMRMSDIKLKAVKSALMPEESLLSYLLPLFRYHDRWNELSVEDIRYFWQKPKIAINGFMLRSDIKPIQPDSVPGGLPRNNYQFGENSYYYLDKITSLCAEKGIPLVLIKAPSLYPYWYPQWDEQMKAYAKKNNLLYINFLDYIDEIGLDFETDTYDAGLHLNIYGAEKLSSYFGSLLRAYLPLDDRRDEPETALRWAQKRAAYQKTMNAQLDDLQAFGKIQTFLIVE